MKKIFKIFTLRLCSWIARLRFRIACRKLLDLTTAAYSANQLVQSLDVDSAVKDRSQLILDTFTSYCLLIGVKTK